MELAKHGVSYVSKGLPIAEIIISVRVPITSDLTEYEFSRQIQKVIDGAIIAHSLMDLNFIEGTVQSREARR